MGATLLEVCKELDELALRVLELIEEQVMCKCKIEDSLKLGYIDLAKTRYIMGNKSVSALQLPTEEGVESSALCTVTVKTDTKLENEVFKLNITSPKGTFFKVEKDVTVRKKIESEKDSDSKEFKNGAVNLIDPIKWFGVLVPQNLRKAQKCFQMTVKLVVESVNIQTELEATQRKFTELKHLKATLLSK